MKNLKLLTLVNLFLLLVSSNRLLSDDYDPYPDNNRTLEFAVNGGYSIITHEKSIFWDNGFNFGLGFNYNLSEDYLIGLSANYLAYYPRPEISQIDREYRYDIYPLILNFQNKLGEMNELEIYAGIGLAYIYGEYIVDDIQYTTSQLRYRLRNKYATNGFGIIPNIKARSPFGQSLAVDISLDYNIIFMESRNGAVLSLDHINAKLALVYIF